MPSPVTGSQPGAALKPWVLQAGFVPFVTSLYAFAKADEYSCRVQLISISDRTEKEHRHTAGLIQPTGLFPAAMRASFTAVMTAAKMGADADVPPLLMNWPDSAMTRGHLRGRLYRLSARVSAVRSIRNHRHQRSTHPFAATSGYARPLLLKMLSA